jgi:hypothetical protein
LTSYFSKTAVVRRGFNAVGSGFRYLLEVSKAPAVHLEGGGTVEVGRKVDVDDLVGTAHIADRLGFSTIQSVHYCFRTDPTFPRPVFEFGDGTGGAKVWNWPDVERWAVRTGRIHRTAR